MKINELKHDHSLTELLKILIFSLLMIAPLFASVSQMLYATFNKNAYQSYGDNTTEQTYINDSSNIQVNTEYYLQNGYKNDLVALPGNASTNIVRFNIIEVIDNPNNYNFNNVIDCGFYSTSTSNYTIGYYFHYNDGTATLNIASNNTFNLKIQITNTTTDFNNSIPYMNILYKIGSSNSLDNAFYYGVEQMTKSDLFNWTQNTALYNGIYGMTSNLEIQTAAIAILLTYWTILTIIYVIIDIVLKGFTYMTHFLQMKV